MKFLCWLWRRALCLLGRHDPYLLGDFPDHTIPYRLLSCRRCSQQWISHYWVFSAAEEAERLSAG